MLVDDGSELALEGIVRAVGKPLRAPLTGEPCVFHRTHARVWSRLDLAATLVTEISEAGHVPFALETSQGALLIDPEHAVLDLPAADLAPPHPDSARRFLAQRGLDRFVASTFADHVLVVPGDRVRVRGTILRERALAASEQGYRDEAVQLKLVGYRQRPLEIRRLEGR